MITDCYKNAKTITEALSQHRRLKISALINIYDVAHVSLKVPKMDLMMKCTDGFDCLFCYLHGNFKKD